MIVQEPMATLQAIDERLEAHKEKRRYYLGISYAGHKCDRFIWLTFRWAKDETLKGRIVRLLKRGQREEKEIIKLLRSVGVVVTETGTHQRLVELSPWVKGHIDAIIKSGLLESPSNEHTAEFKTSNDEAFQLLKKQGMKLAKPMHYTQTQLYMLGSGIGRNFYWCVNKNNDEVYTERTKLDESFANKAKDRAIALSTEPNLPAPLSNKPTWYECKMCHFWGLCHNHETADKSCRTCEYGRFNEDGTLTCTHTGKVVKGRAQERACDSYKLHFDLEQLRTKE